MSFYIVIGSWPEEFDFDPQQRQGFLRFPLPPFRPTPSIKWKPQAFFQGSEQLRSEVNHSCPSSTETYNSWSMNSSPVTCSLSLV